MPGTRFTAEKDVRPHVGPPIYLGPDSVSAHVWGGGKGHAYKRFPAFYCAGYRGIIRLLLHVTLM